MRPIIAVIVGVIFGGFFVAFAESAMHSIIPMDLELPKTVTEARNFMEDIPMAFKIGLIVGWGIAGFVAAIVTTFIQGRTEWKPMLVTVGILQLLTYMNMITFTHPGWMWITVTFLYVPIGFIAYLLIRKKKINESI